MIECDDEAIMSSAMLTSNSDAIHPTKSHGFFIVFDMKSLISLAAYLEI